MPIFAEGAARDAPRAQTTGSSRLVRFGLAFLADHFRKHPDDPTTNYKVVKQEELAVSSRKGKGDKGNAEEETESDGWVAHTRCSLHPRSWAASSSSVLTWSLHAR